MSCRGPGCRFRGAAAPQTATAAKPGVQKICNSVTNATFNRAIFYSGPIIFYNIFPRSSTTARQFARLFLSTTVGEPSRAAVPGAVPEEPAVLAEEG